MPERRSQRTPYARRSRQAQKRAYWQVLCHIRRAAPVLGGRFYTHNYMHGENSWIDGYFLGKRKPVFYNFAIQTVLFAYKDRVGDRAWDLSYELAPVDLDPSIFERTVKDPVSGLYVASLHEPYRYPEFNGMTRYDWAQSQHQRIADSLEIKVPEKWTLHHDYHSGVGLHATIDVPFLTIDAVNEFIDRFLQSESDFTNQTPRSFRFDQIAQWGPEANSVCHPWEWDATNPSLIGTQSTHRTPPPRLG